MMNKKVATSTNNNTNYEYTMAETCAAMDDFGPQNQTLENFILHIQQRQQKSGHMEKIKVFDP